MPPVSLRVPEEVARSQRHAQAVSACPGAPRISVVIPVYNDAASLVDCLAALRAAATADTEIIVVDDASTDGSASLAERAGVTVIRLPRNSGPAVARNYGAARAQGEILFFVDSDVAVAPDAVRRVLALFDQRPEVAGVFGSYDTTPRAPGLVSQYRNLLHHFVHQQANSEAATFWAGCGAMRRSIFALVDGFDEGAFGRAIEDIELGYRVRRAGHRIFLDKGLLGKHLKAWTLRSLIRTDVMVRAIPWSRLIMQHGSPNDLNLRTDQRLSAVLVLLLVATLLVAPFRPMLLAPAVGALAAIVILNRPLYAFFLRLRGLRFTAAAIPLHLLYYLYSTGSFAWVWFGVRWSRLGVGRRA
jgi:glycosyltransferase involved in cell wall biosynthesis